MSTLSHPPKIYGLSKQWFRTSVIFMVIAMLIGVYMRMTFVWNPLGWNFRHLVHAHSHIILLGWVFNAICSFMVFTYRELKLKFVKRVFILMQISVIGMLVCFPIYGYGAISIVFSTGHIFISYFFIVYFIIRTWLDGALSTRFMRLGSIYLLLSTLGPFGLVVIILNGLQESPLYDLAIYFYLHFLYN